MLDLSQMVPGGGNKAFPFLPPPSLAFSFSSLSFLPSFFPVFSSFISFVEGLPVLR